MNVHVIALAVAGVIAAGFIIAICREGRRIKRAQACASVPEPAPVEAVIDLEPGIDLDLRDKCDLLWSLPAFERPADHTTTSTEGD